MKYEKTESANAIYLTYRLSITVHGICATYNKILSYTNLSYIFIYLPIVLQAIVCKSNIEEKCAAQKVRKYWLYHCCTVSWNSCFSYFSRIRWHVIQFERKVLIWTLLRKIEIEIVLHKIAIFKYIDGFSPIIHILSREK